MQKIILIIPSFLALVLMFVYLFVIAPYKEDKERFAKKAAEIAKFFGEERTLTLARFTTFDEQYGKGQVYAFLPNDCRNKSFEDLYNVQHYYYLTEWSEKSAATKKDVDKQLRIVKDNLPYLVVECDTGIGWEVFDSEFKSHKKANEMQIL